MLTKWARSVVLLWEYVHQIVFVDPVLEEKVDEANARDHWCNHAEENSNRPNDSDESQLVTLVDVPCVFELVRRELQVWWETTEEELLG